MKYTDKLLIKKEIRKGERIIPKDNRSVTVAVAMVDFKEGDIGIFDYDIAYPIKYKDELLMVPGLKKCSEKESEKIKKGLNKNEVKKQKKTTRNKFTKK